ncbi:MAG: 50S ribosomal protein L32 [Candidatus Omnitrophica bacterium]|nr:50S ribosomal protein L32 [Candidatus Omnitrophota bacterium]
MAHPKRRHSSTRQKKRRTHYKLKSPALTKCSSCDKPVLSHHVCPACGHYKGKQVVVKKEKKKKPKK